MDRVAAGSLEISYEVYEENFYYIKRLRKKPPCILDVRAGGRRMKIIGQCLIYLTANSYYYNSYSYRKYTPRERFGAL